MGRKKFVVGALVILLLAGLTGVSGHFLGIPAWQQVNSSGFGDLDAAEVSALGSFNSHLYAGTHNPVDYTQIYRSPDGVAWDPVINPGFGIPHDTAPPAILDMLVFNGRLYASTGRGDGPGQIWRTLDGVNWAPMVIAGFNDPDLVDITALAEYSGKIYAGATHLISGAQIWSSFTGDNNSWAQVGPTMPGTPPEAVSGFAVFDGGLYASVESDAPAEIWVSYGGDWSAVMDNGFGDSQTTFIGGLAVFGTDLYAGAGNVVAGAQLWRTADGSTWEQVNIPGLSDTGNAKVEAVVVFGNQLYISVKNASAGLRLWRSADGMVWERANLDGFGDANNTGSNWSNAVEGFLSQLYLGTLNAVEGGELWQMEAQGAPPTPTGSAPPPSPTPSSTPPPGGVKVYLPVVVRQA
jgi:hypothetical protein